MRDYFHIHINKTGGMSIRNLLGRRKDRHTAAELKKVHGAEEWERRFTFSMIRNPWDRIASLWKYRRKRNMHYVKTDDMGFEEFVRSTLLYHEVPYWNNPIMFAPQDEWLSEPVDFIGVFENYETSVRIILDKLDYPEDDPEIPHENASPGKHYKELHTDYTRGLVGRHFQHDLQRWGYTFDSHPSIDEVNNW